MDWKPQRSDSKTLFSQIHDWMLGNIERGNWPISMRLPSQRKLAHDLGVNRSTIIQVFEELKAKGVLETIHGGGTFVSSNGWELLLARKQPNWNGHMQNSLYTPNVETIQLINEFEQKSEVLRLGTGELSPELLPLTKLRQSLTEMVLTEENIRYSSPKGNIKLRHAVASHLKKKGISAFPENILIVSGALQALQLISYGILAQHSTVYYSAPSYVESIQSFQAAGMKLIPIEAEARNIANKNAFFYTIPTLNNPSGTIMSEKERNTLMQRCRQDQIPIVEDDVYGDLTFTDSPPPLKAMDTSGQIVYVGGMSKTISPGLRIGWITAPEPIINSLADLKMQLDYGSSGFSQEIVTYWLQSGLYETHVHSLRTTLQKRAQSTETMLNETFADIATWESPKGGFYIWLRFNQPIIKKDVFKELLQHNVLINPGYLYDQNDNHHIRLSYAYESLDRLAIGLTRLNKVVRKRLLINH